MRLQSLGSFKFITKSPASLHWFMLMNLKRKRICRQKCKIHSALILQIALETHLRQML
jgi:hypothetical protein